MEGKGMRCPFNQKINYIKQFFVKNQQKSDQFFSSKIGSDI